MRVRNFIETRYIFSDNKRKQANSIAICCFSPIKVEKTCVCCRRNQKTETMYLTKQKLPWSKLNITLPNKNIRKRKNTSDIKTSFHVI